MASVCSKGCAKRSPFFPLQVFGTSHSSNKITGLVCRHFLSLRHHLLTFVRQMPVKVSLWQVGITRKGNYCMGQNGQTIIFFVSPGLVKAFHIFMKGQCSFLLELGGSIMDLLLHQIGETFSQTIPASIFCRCSRLKKYKTLISTIY